MEGNADSILIVDDDPAVRRLLTDMLMLMSNRTLCAADGDEALKLLEEHGPVSVVLLDLNLPGMNGIEVLKKITAKYPGSEVVLFSSSLGVQDAVVAMKHGAYYCLSKPFSYEELERCVRQALNKTIVHKEIRCDGISHGPMIIASNRMKKVTNVMVQISKSPATTVLITGETGTGKEVVARHLHHLSDRKDSSFVAVNCAAIPESLIESELFGHERGAFTDARSPRKGLFMEAHGGTLFLDEIGDLPLAMQVKLLRVLQERVIRPVGAQRDVPVDIRIIAATNRSLPLAVREGEFREDLFYRLCVIPLKIPPLRERKEDIPVLAEHFLKHFSLEFGRTPRELEDEEREELMNYNWPGNVRELRNAVERSVLLSSSRIQCGTSPISSGLSSDLLPSVDQDQREESIVLELEDPSLANVERELILKVMARVHGNKNQAASMLGVNRTTLYRKLSSYGLDGLDETACNEEAGTSSLSRAR